MDFFYLRRFSFQSPPKDYQHVLRPILLEFLLHHEAVWAYDAVEQNSWTHGPALRLARTVCILIHCTCSSISRTNLRDAPKLYIQVTVTGLSMIQTLY
jgi:hypothetical protein